MMANQQLYRLQRRAHLTSKCLFSSSSNFFVFFQPIKSLFLSKFDFFIFFMVNFILYFVLGGVMFRILLYIFIISFGFFLSKYHLIPLKLKLKTSFLQSLSLFFLLAVMGYKIGSDNKIIEEFPSLGLQAIVIAIFSILGSVFITKFFFRKRGDK